MPLVGLLLSRRRGKGIGDMFKEVPCDVAEATRLYEGGMTLMQVGERLDCSWMTVQRRLKAAGVEIRHIGRGGKAENDALTARILKLHEQGLSDYEIADALDTSRGIVNYRMLKVFGSRGKGRSFARECVCPRCGKRFTTMVKNQQFCSSACRNAASLQRRDDEKRANTDGPIEEIPLREIYDRDRGRCYICGGRTDWGDYRIVNGFKVCGPRYPSRDHVIALHNGGTHTRDNIRLACWECNSLKSDKGQMRLPVAI